MSILVETTVDRQIIFPHFLWKQPTLRYLIHVLMLIGVWLDNWSDPNCFSSLTFFSIKYTYNKCITIRNNFQIISEIDSVLLYTASQQHLLFNCPWRHDNLPHEQQLCLLSNLWWSCSFWWGEWPVWRINLLRWWAICSCYWLRVPEWHCQAFK